MNSIKAETKSVLRQLKKINSLHKARPNTLEYESYKFMEEQRVRSNLKRLIPTMILIAAFLTIVLFLCMYRNSIKSDLFSKYFTAYMSLVLVIIIYVFTIAKQINAKKLNIIKAKVTYMSFWIINEITICAFIINNFNKGRKFEAWLIIFVLCLVAPIFNRLETFIMVYISLILSIFIVCYLNFNYIYLIIAVCLLALSTLVFLTTYYSKMKLMYTQSVIEQRGYLVQRRIDGLFHDLFDEVYEININTNEFTLVHSKTTFQASHMKDSYEKSIDYITKKLLHPNDVEAYKKKFSAENLKDAFRQGKKQIYQESRRLKVDGTYAWVSTLIIREYSPNENEFKLMQLVQDIDSRKVSENKLKIEAQRDPLTKLYNKMTTQKLIEEYLNNEGCDGTHAFIIIDMDEFKDINDTKGHFAGDDVLVALSDKLRKYFRESDVLGRIGGDEFVAFIKNIQSVALVCDKVQKLSCALKVYGIESEYSQRLSTSMGIAIYSKDGKTYEELYKNADKALYEAKRNGKDQYKFCIRENIDVG